MAIKYENLPYATVAKAKPPKIVVDGSNFATAGRSVPSLAQLIAAVETIVAETPTVSRETVCVIVDATFEYRIDPAEESAYRDALAAGWVIAAPAGTVGRGDAFILQIAEKAGAVVFSNDSFQEFHSGRKWLFEDGRLFGGKPIPGLGWVLTMRRPVGVAKVATAAKSVRKTPAKRATRGAGSVARRAERRGSLHTQENDPEQPAPFPGAHPMDSLVHGEAAALNGSGS
jgi:hypothetical protein